MHLYIPLACMGSEKG